MDDKIYDKIIGALEKAKDVDETVAITFTAQELFELSGELIKADFYNALDQLIGAYKAYKDINENVQNDF